MYFNIYIWKLPEKAYFGIRLYILTWLCEASRDGGEDDGEKGEQKEEEVEKEKKMIKVDAILETWKKSINLCKNFTF